MSRFARLRSLQAGPASLWRRVRGGLPLAKFAVSGLDLLYPPRCAVCRMELPVPHGGPLLCDDCRGRLLAEAGFRCPRCGGSTPASVAPGERCHHCRKDGFQFTRTVALGVYRGVLKDAVMQMKRPGRGEVAIAVAELYWETRAAELQALGAEVLVPIPMHWRRRWLQGTNSPELIAETLGRRLKLPIVRRMLLRRRNDPPQGTLTAAKRRHNVRGAMGLGRSHVCRNQRILLVDDVLTTGATCQEAARTLRRAGAAGVYVAVLARGEGEE